MTKEISLISINQESAIAPELERQPSEILDAYLNDQEGDVVNRFAAVEYLLATLHKKMMSGALTLVVTRNTKNANAILEPLIDPDLNSLGEIDINEKPFLLSKSNPESRANQDQITKIFDAYSTKHSNPSLALKEIAIDLKTAQQRNLLNAPTPKKI